MKKVILLILAINCSCISQSKKELDIKGNWYNFSIKDKDRKSLDYVETFIDDYEFHSYNEYFGFQPNMEYVIEDGVLYYIGYLESTDKEKNKEEAGKVEIIDDNTISIHNGEIILKRITDGLKFEDVLMNNIHENEYREHFNKRKAQWKKRQ